MADVSPLIVISDHDRDYLNLMEELLVEEGYRAIVITGGPDVHPLIVREQPALAIVDMPIKDPDEGWRLLTMLRLSPRTKALPILICSTNTQLMRDNTERLEAMGCKLLAKPFGLEEMLSLIRELLDVSVAQASARAVGIGIDQ